MFDGQDQDGSSQIVEANAVITGAEAQLWRFDILKALHIAFAGGQLTGHAMQDMEGGGLVDSAQIGFGLLGPGDLLPHYLPVSWGSRGVRAMRSKSSDARPNSASTCS